MHLMKQPQPRADRRLPVIAPGLCRLGRLLALLVVGALAWSANRSVAAAGSEAPAGFRVMTFNIHHGEGMDGRIDLDRIVGVIQRERADEGMDGRIDLDRIVGVIQRERADLVALQEVDKGVERTARRDFPAELARLSGMACVFSNNFSYQGGEYGNALLTRFPVRTTTNTWLRMLRAGEQRGVLQVTLDVRGRELLFLATHLDYRREDTERLLNVAQIDELTSRTPGVPILVAGDFNDTPGSRTHQAMEKRFDDVWLLAGPGDGYTIPVTKPDRRIDYIWRLKGSPLRAVRAWVPRTDASDHLPVVAEFTWE